MTTITTLVGTDGITAANSMVKINTNFENLNHDKIETSVIDTDTALSANSDEKIPSQKAVKSYVDSGGNVNASETNKGIVEEATDTEVTNGSSTGGTGAKLFITPAKLSTYLSTGLSAPIVRTYTTTSTFLGDSTTRYDITNPSGTTFRYTYDGTGTNPSITSSNPATGAYVAVRGQNFSSGNNGSFVVTSSGTNYFEVSNSSGVAENDKTLGTGYLAIGTVWNKPSGLKYLNVTVQGAGAGSGGSGGAGDYSGGAGAGATALKNFAASTLPSFVTVVVGAPGAGSPSKTTSGSDGKLSSFHTVVAGGGIASTAATGAAPVVTNGGIGGTATGGDINAAGNWGQAGGTHGQGIGYGANSFLGGYGNGANGVENANGNTGTQGTVVLTEYYV